MMTDRFGGLLFRDGTFPRGRPMTMSVLGVAAQSDTPDAFFKTFRDGFC